MKIKGSWLISVSIIVILFLIGYAFFIYNRSQHNAPPKTDYKLNPVYPRNLIEGVITSIEISLPEGKFKVEVNLNQIFQEEISSTREVTVLIDSDTEFLLFEFGTGSETKIKMEDFKKGDSVVVAIEEENTEILTRDTFTAIRIKKMVDPLPK